MSIRMISKRSANGGEPKMFAEGQPKSPQTLSGSASVFIMRNIVRDGYHRMHRNPAFSYVYVVQIIEQRGNKARWQEVVGSFTAYALTRFAQSRKKHQVFLELSIALVLDKLTTW